MSKFILRKASNTSGKGEADVSLLRQKIAGIEHKKIAEPPVLEKVEIHDAREFSYNVSAPNHPPVRTDSEGWWPHRFSFFIISHHKVETNRNQ